MQHSTSRYLPIEIAILRVRCAVTLTCPCVLRVVCVAAGDITRDGLASVCLKCLFSLRSPKSEGAEGRHRDEPNTVTKFLLHAYVFAQLRSPRATLPMRCTSDPLNVI